MFISAHREVSGFSNAEWPVALPALEDALGEAEEFALVLEMLSVAVRYASSGDETVLLELPLELRSLIAPDAHHAA
jgi:hypothetical protein